MNAAALCRICGDAEHPLSEPETPDGLRFGRWIAERAATDTPPEAWCIHSAAAHSCYYEDIDASTGAYFTRERAIEEATRLCVRDESHKSSLRVSKNSS